MSLNFSLKKPLTFVVFLVLSLNYIFGQDKSNIKFGKVSLDDFLKTSPAVDSNADAVVIADIGSCEFEGNNKGWFTLVYKRYTRIRIINKNGFNAATIAIGLYTRDESTEKLEDLNGFTYNIENGKIIQTKLDSKSIFTDQLRKNVVAKKFTFPGVKEGSVIEYVYTIKSDFLFALQPWEFQGEYPCLWSEYTVKLPGLFNYVCLKQGSTNYFLKQTDTKNVSFIVTEPAKTYGSTDRSFNVSCNVYSTRWVMKDVPAFKTQNYTSTIDNYVSKLEFQLSEYRFPDEPIEDKLKDWNSATLDLLKYSDFGKPLTDDNSWLDNEMKDINGNEISELEKTKKVYAFVRDNFTCTGNRGIFLSDRTTLKDVYKKRNGSVSDINLLLIAMLQYERIKADPVILSTKGNGVVHPVYPMLEKFNYVICRVKIKDESYYLDATNPLLGFGKLLPECYNGLARVISNQPEGVFLKADALTETKRTSVTILNGKEEMTAGFSSDLGYNESLQLRKKLSNVKQEEYFTDRAKNYSYEMKIENGEIDSFKNLDKPVTLKYDMKFNLGNDDIIYFNPMFNEPLKENPFKAEQRLYPVEMPYCIDETYTMNMEIPKGYKIDELPKQTTIQLNGNQGKFDYQITQNDTKIQLRCRLQINRTMFDASDYATLRSFFADVVKTENEQIVFKKAN